MSMKDKLHTGELYLPDDGEIMKEQSACMELLYDFNATRPSEMEKRTELLKKMFAEIGEGCYIEPPFHANWGGHNVHFGSHVYANFSLTVVDDTHIYVGDHTMIGPNVTIATGGHPVLPALRERGMQYNMPVRIGKNCWIGAGALIMPGFPGRQMKRADNGRGRNRGETIRGIRPPRAHSSVFRTPLPTRS